MLCDCCNLKLKSGMVKKTEASTGQRFKSCPNCTTAKGNMHVFHPYPAAFGSTSARVTAKNPDGDQSYCSDCRRLDKDEISRNYTQGRSCNTLI